jgi:Spy/CpxP family protein refolding chaperone
MKDLRESYKGKFEALRNDKNLSDENKKAQMKDLMKQQQDKMKQILTPEQQEKIKSQRKDKSDRNTR